jgi:hypothetical protein
MLRVLRGSSSRPQTDEFLERAIEVVDVLQGVLDILLAEHRGADLNALVESFLVHDASSLSGSALSYVAVTHS